MTLIINGQDFSAYIQQKTDITETMRRIVGPAQDTAVDGTEILDLVKIKWDPAFRLKPLPKSMMQQLLAMMELEQVTIQYESVVQNTLREIEAEPVSITVQYAMDWNGEEIYADTPISFMEV